MTREDITQRKNTEVGNIVGSNGEITISQALNIYDAGVQCGKDYIMEEACDWLRDHITVDDVVDMVDEHSPEALSYIKAAQHRAEVANEIVEEFKKVMEAGYNG